MIIKIKSTFKIHWEQFNSFHIRDLSIGNTDINSQAKLELVRWHFPAFATKWFAENQKKSFSEAACRLVSRCSIFEEYV